MWLVRPSLAGASLSARIRRLTFAVFVLPVAAGLALVAFVAQSGYPALSVPPLPIPGQELTAPDDVALGGATGLGVGGPLGALPGSSSAGGGSSGVFAVPADGDWLGAVGLGGHGGSSGPGQGALGNNPGLHDEQHSGVVAVTPSQLPTVPPEAALAAVPVSGSSPSSALFVRSSVAPGVGEEGDIADSAPVPPVEPELPVEPEPPVEVPPVEPPVEPEPPVEVPVEPPPAPGADELESNEEVEAAPSPEPITGELDLPEAPAGR